VTEEALINRLRPQTFGEVYGHKKEVKSFIDALKDGNHTFLFTGTRGVGKTSLARLGADFLGAKSKANRQEINGAQYNSVDNTRALVEALSYKPLGGSNKVIIIDECHRMSQASWEPLLKITEEPHKWLYFFFCTTDPSKVPATIQSRCTKIFLKPFKITEIFEYLQDVCDAEKYDTPDSILDLVAKSANGSLRDALSLLSACYKSTDRSEAAKLIAKQEASEGGVSFQLAQAIAQGRSWKDIQRLLMEISESKEETAETARHVVVAYFTKAVLSAKDEKAACAGFQILDNFSEPFNSADGLTPLVVAVGRSVFVR
jgi:DNA polymerase III subunit gamma/tau